MLLSFINLKGGVGKTSSAFQLASFLHSRLFSVLAIDLDPQANFSSLTRSSHSNSAFRLLLGDEPVASLISSPPHSFHIIPASFELNAVDELLLPSAPLHRRASVLRSRLSPILDSYDFIIIDTPPHLRVLALNALAASDKVIVPVLPDPFSSNGLSQLSNVVDLVRSSLNPSLLIDGVLISRFNPRTRLSRSILPVFQKVASALSTKIYDTKIRDSVRLAEANASLLSIFDFDPSSPVASDFISFFHELLGGVVDEKIFS